MVTGTDEILNGRAAQIKSVMPVLDKWKALHCSFRKHVAYTHSHPDTGEKMTSSITLETRRIFLLCWFLCLLFLSFLYWKFLLFLTRLFPELF